MDYERETRSWYRDAIRAVAYQQKQTRQWSWAWLATRREQAVIARLIRGLGFRTGSVVFDVPCGTGILGRVLNSTDCGVLAADISTEMMSLARRQYQPTTFLGFLQADLIRLPLAPKSVDGVFVLGFLHRVPQDIRRAALSQVAAVSRGHVVATFTIDTALQRIKTTVLGVMWRGYKPAPQQARLADIVSDCAAAGLKVVQIYRPVPFLSGNAVMVLEHQKRETC